ncbi:MAG: hypothetical protein DRN27_10055 [Thermoplasmata archaeon]|nr:MAG: hypothetical protein DRN27_10055 [Thermoplasmata archaeon]
MYPGEDSTFTQTKLFSLDPIEKKDLVFNELGDLVAYVQWLSDIAKNKDGKEKGKFRNCANSLIYDHHLINSIPNIQLEYLLNDCGIHDYDAWLDPEKPFKKYVVSSSPLIEDLVSQVKHGIVKDLDYFKGIDKRYEYIPTVQAEKNNPYKKWLSTKSSACMQLNKILDLPINNAIWELTLTYPSEVSALAVTNGCEFAKKEMKKCFKKFFAAMHQLKIEGKDLVKPDHKLGCIENTHLFSSKDPIKPHCHHHVTMPGVSVKWAKSGFNGSLNQNLRLNREKADLQLKDQYADIETLRSDIKDLINSRQETLDQIILETQNKEELMLKSYCKQLCQILGINALPWFFNEEDERNVPIPTLELKQLWKKTVISHFKKYVDLSKYADPDFNFDIQTKYSYYRYRDKAETRARVGHWLKYSKRHPSLDLDEYFRYNPGLISYDGKVEFNIEKVSDPELKENLERFDHIDILNFIEDLVRSDNKTHYYGFCTSIKNFRILPDGKDEPRVSYSILDGYLKSFVNVVKSVPASTDIYYSRKRLIWSIPPMLDPGGG